MKARRLHSFLASVLYRGSGSIHGPAALKLNNERLYPLNMSLGGSQSRYGHMIGKKNLSPLPGLETRTVQSVSSDMTTALSNQFFPLKSKTLTAAL